MIRGDSDMPCGRVVLGLPVLVAVLVTRAFAGPFALFPKSTQLASPNGRFVVHNAAREAPASEFVGAFESLWLIDRDTGRSRKLFDYTGIAVVAWSGNDSLLVTEYMGKKTSRMLVLDVTRPEDSILIDLPTLVRLVAVQFREALRQNDHVFVEASKLEGTILHFRVWGYGQHDPNGFAWGCEYAMGSGAVSCENDRAPNTGR